MGSETHESISVRVRRKLGLPESAALGIQPLVDPGLRRLCYELAKDSHLRHWVMTDPATTSVTLDASGVADLTALVASPRIILEALRFGEIFPPTGYPSTLPFRFVEHAGQGQLAGAYDALQYKCYLQGDNLYTKSPDANVTPLAGDISFRVPMWKTISQLDNSLTDRLVDLISSLGNFSAAKA